MPLVLDDINTQMDAICDFVDDLTATQLANVVRIQLKQKAFKFLYQQYQNIVSWHYNATMTEWLIRHGYEAGDEMLIDLQIKVAIYLEANPDTTLDGEELEQAAYQAWVAEMNTIDAEINTTMQPLIKPTLGQSVVAVQTLKLKVDGFETQIDNKLKAAIVATLRE